MYPTAVDNQRAPEHKTQRNSAANNEEGYHSVILDIYQLVDKNPLQIYWRSLYYAKKNL